MRSPATKDRLRQLLRELGRRSRGPGRIYLCGGATALLHGWRSSTVDVDLMMDPEPPGVFEAIAGLKQDLDLNIELAGPTDFLPALPGWRDRCLWIGREGQVDFLHYDPYLQALTKIARGHARDRSDVASMVRDGLVDPRELGRLFASIEPQLLRYPRVDPDDLAARVQVFVQDQEEQGKQADHG